MGRYPLLLEEARKRTPANHMDQTFIPQARDAIKDLMQAINVNAGQAIDSIKLHQLSEQLTWTSDKVVSVCAHKHVVLSNPLISERGGAQFDRFPTTNYSRRTIYV
jgi:hypothetical protein